MSSCDNCESDRILEINAKCADRCHSSYKGVDKSDYPPSIPGLCGNDYVDPSVCLDCGKVQGEFPVDDPEGFDRLECIECGVEPSPRLNPYEGQNCEQQGCRGYLMPVE